MRKYLVLLLVITSGFACIVIITILFGKPIFFMEPQRETQEALANELGVRVEDYPPRSSFPVEYFYSVLSQGMTITDVHSVIRGYEKVLHCGSTSEIYYFYSPDLESAKRFKIIYDNQGKFVRLEGEEDDSHTIQIFGCETGQIEK